jgi:hypothetical protein
MEPSSLPSDPLGSLAFIKGAYESKAWTLLVAAVLMVAVRLVTMFKVVYTKLPPEGAKWLALTLSVASSLGTNLLTGSGWTLAIINGMTAGLMAVGAWEAIGKTLLAGKKADV